MTFKHPHLSPQDLWNSSFSSTAVQVMELDFILDSFWISRHSELS